MTTTAPVTPAVPPGPRTPSLLQTLLFMRDRRRTMMRLRARYGDVFTMRIAPGARRFVLLTRPEHFKEVFAGSPSVFHAGEGNAILGPVMGEHSVLLVDEGAHQRARKLLLPAFGGAALRSYAPLVTELAAAETGQWPAGTVFRAHEAMQTVTLEVILRVVFGLTGGERLAELRPLVRRLVDIGPRELFGWFYPALQRFGVWRRFAQVQQRVDELIYAEIAERRALGDAADGDDVLSRLLRAGSGDSGEPPLTDAELRDQLITLLLAGHETTATALAWTLHELARNPDVRARALRAADDGDEEYLGAVLKEAMRLRPVIAQVARKLTEPAEVAGRLLPAGVTVAPSISMVQADPEFHDGPAEFRPERFLDGTPAPNTWVPFGGGVRRCIGAGFSLMEGTAILREVLVRFDVRPARDAPEDVKQRNITHVPSRGAEVILTRR